jgi:hypothetical protein
MCSIHIMWMDRTELFMMKQVKQLLVMRTQESLIDS